MGKKIGYLIMTWVFVSLAYVILAVSMPALTELSDLAAVTMAASSNMTNYPGTIEAVQSFPLYVWFIPGGVGFIATVVFMKTDIVK